MDKFHEQLLRTKKSPLYKLLVGYMYLCLVLVILTLVLSLLALNLKIILFTIIFTASFFAVRYLKDKQYKEFEYIFTNGNIQIDVIYSMKKRKKLYDVDIKDLEDFGISKDIKVSNGVKKVICIPWDNKDVQYVLVINGHVKQAVYIAPNEEMLKLINIYNVRRPRL